MKASPHPREAERLATLHRYGVLDTPREEEFDEVVRLAARICDAPIAVINLIDSDRQWFKAEIGLGTRETPLETSICSHAILEEAFVEIPDTQADPRMRDNPLCAGEPGLRFYAGALLVAENGLPLGTLCVLDYQPRGLNDLQREAMQVLARQVVRQLDLRRAMQAQELIRHEADHRIKNSLQTVFALLKIQQRSVQGPEARRVLEETSRRIQMIAALHRELYEGKGGAEIDVKPFMGKIERLLRGTMPRNLRLEMAFDDARIDARQASAIAIIVNEFLSNSGKHAFPDGREGTVRVTGRLRGGEARVVCEDDGVGANGAAAADDGLGLKIIEASALQLGGTLAKPATETGFRLELTFPLTA